MRTLSFITTMIVGIACMCVMPAKANSPTMSGLAAARAQVAVVEEVGWRKRYYRRYGYPVPYAYYPPAYGYYAPPAYGYYAPVYPAYRYYAPYQYYRPYYAPYY